MARPYCLCHITVGNPRPIFEDAVDRRFWEKLNGARYDERVATRTALATNPSHKASWEVGESSPWTWAAIHARLAMHRLVRRTGTHDLANAAEVIEMSLQTEMLRCIFGNPFRPIAIDRRWLTPNVVNLSQAIYEERSFKKIPILANALMDAGCDCEEMLAHCRGDGFHARGCWLVDMELRKV